MKIWKGKLICTFFSLLNEIQPSFEISTTELAALWKFDGGNIVSKTGINLCTVGKHKYCKIPNVGTEGGYITRELDDEVLGLSPGQKIAEWETKADNRPDQKWERSPFDTKNYFTLTNKDRKKMLHGLRGAYQENKLNNGQPHMPSKELVYFRG